MINDMKYNSNYECVQNCTPGTELLHTNMNGKCGNLAIPVDMSVVVSSNQLCADEFSKSITSLNSADNRKSVTRKTCTCSSGMVPCPCPSHSGTERSSINGYTNSFTQFQQQQCDRINIKTCTKRITSCKPIRNEIPAENDCFDELQKPIKNGKIFPKTYKKLPQTDEQLELDDTLLSSRTFTMESTSCHLMNNCDNAKPNGRDLNVNSNLDELRLSLTSLISKDATTPDEKQATEAFQKWLAEKKRQEREIRQRESNLQQLIKQERQKKIQMEQENFLNWLHAKKEKEKQEKESKKKALEEEQRRKNEKLRREEINKKQYQLWLKLKEEQDLVKKINEQKRKIEKEERERQRLARNQSAFQEWLISSKDKPKPVPLNQGLESLRTSTSVAFINPAPWVPNIVEKTKAKSK